MPGGLKQYKIVSAITFSILFFTSSLAQVFKTNFTKPVNLPFNLAGSFGEPRPDHFHSGIDIKTNGAEGQPVFAVGDGYISRIRVSPYGYGKAIYITHPNGYTSVYGHLSAFYASIEQYIHEHHYKTKQSELDLSLDTSVFPVKQNDTVAYSGNTGGSTAPHLHFEIRDSKTEHALNPLDFYPKEFYADTIPPQLNKIKIYQFNDNFYDAYTQVLELKKVDSYLTTENPITILDFSSFCFSLEGFDKQDTSENKNGIYKIEVLQGNDTIFKYTMNEIDFDKTRMCNAFVDYNEMMNDSGYFYNCFQLKNNTLSIYLSTNDGYFKFKNNDTIDLDVFCYDYRNNKTRIRLSFIKFVEDIDTAIIRVKSNDSKYISSNLSDSISNNNFKIIFSNYTFYEDIVLRYSLSDKSKGISENYLVFNANIIPLQKPAKIQFSSFIKKKRNKIVIVRQNNKGEETALKTTFDNKKFYTSTYELGTFYLKYDTFKPIIERIDIKDNKIQAKITDELSGIQSYNGYIDGQWVNFYYDAKNDLITYRFDEYCQPGEHNLKIVVTDAKGNMNTLTQHFKN